MLWSHVTLRDFSLQDRESEFRIRGFLESDPLCPAQKKVFYRTMPILKQGKNKKTQKRPRMATSDWVFRDS